MTKEISAKGDLLIGGLGGILNTVLIAFVIYITNPDGQYDGGFLGLAFAFLDLVFCVGLATIAMEFNKISKQHFWGFFLGMGLGVVLLIGSLFLDARF